MKEIPTPFTAIVFLNYCGKKIIVPNNQVLTLTNPIKCLQQRQLSPYNTRYVLLFCLRQVLQINGHALIHTVL